MTVAIRHDLGFEDVKQYYREYLSLQAMNNFIKILKDNDGLLPFINRVAEKIKTENFLVQMLVISLTI